MKITYVKKILADGSPCRKCADVTEKLETSGHMARINEVLVADERDSSSAGMQIAKQYNVDRAPFFVVEQDGQAPRIYTVYLKFVKEVLDQQSGGDDVDELKEIMQDNSDLDFL